MLNGVCMGLGLRSVSLVDGVSLGSQFFEARYFFRRGVLIELLFRVRGVVLMLG